MANRILVVGGTGHTGERVARRLQTLGNQVVVLTREPRGEAARSLEAWGIGVREGDCTRRWTLWDALEGCDALVSCSHPRHAGACVQACKTIGVSRIIAMSSTWRFTRFPSVTSEEVIEGESQVAVSGLEWTMIRPTLIYGGRRDNNVERLFAWFRKRRWFPIFGRGTNLVQPVFVEDVVSALVAAWETPDSVGHAFNVAGPDPIDYGRFIRDIAKAAGRRSVKLLHVPRWVGETVATVGAPVLRAKGVTRDQLRRMGEDKHVNIEAAWELLKYRPRSFTAGLKLKAEGRAEVDSFYPQPGLFTDR